MTHPSCIPAIDSGFEARPLDFRDQLIFKEFGISSSVNGYDTTNVPDLVRPQPVPLEGGRIG